MASCRAVRGARGLALAGQQALDALGATHQR